MQDPVERLLTIMATLRHPDLGCDWDKAQDFSTIAPYTIEEAYEVADAIDRNAMGELRDELGDLLLQVVFHSRMAEEAGHFDFQDVASAISEKMERRHPHIFGEADGGHQPARWEELKAAERQEKGSSSALDGVALALPALLRAEKLQKRAARVGFDWPDASGAREKVIEEIAEVDEATSGTLEEEFGDLLFAAVNWARKCGIDPENALKKANRKFELRFHAMESAANGQFASLDLQSQEELWLQAKRDLAKTGG